MWCPLAPWNINIIASTCRIKDFFFGVLAFMILGVLGMRKTVSNYSFVQSDQLKIAELVTISCPGRHKRVCKKVTLNFRVAERSSGRWVYLPPQVTIGDVGKVKTVDCTACCILDRAGKLERMGFWKTARGAARHPSRMSRAVLFRRISLT